MERSADDVRRLVNDVKLDVPAPCESENQHPAIWADWSANLQDDRKLSSSLGQAHPNVIRDKPTRDLLRAQPKSMESTLSKSKTANQPHPIKFT